LTTLLAWLLPMGILERYPTLKAEMDAIQTPDDAATKGRSVPVAFYIHPVMQVSNSLLARAHLVPVGVDQLPHVELKRQVARRFNRELKPIFLEPEPLVGRVPRLLGTNGHAKMSKSRGNTIDLKDGPDAMAKIVRTMDAGPPRRANEPGMVEANALFASLDAFDNDAAELNELLGSMRQRRALFESNMSQVREALEHGTSRARGIARETMAIVHDALDLDYLGKYR
jgi:tryptophanyl-tRNA synthetase